MVQDQLGHSTNHILQCHAVQAPTSGWTQLLNVRHHVWPVHAKAGNLICPHSWSFCTLFPFNFKYLHKQSDPVFDNTWVALPCVVRKHGGQGFHGFVKHSVVWWLHFSGVFVLLLWQNSWSLSCRWTRVVDGCRSAVQGALSWRLGNKLFGCHREL